MGLWQATFVARVNDALAMMTKEEELLSWNLIAIGGCLHRFIYCLVDKLSWTQLSKSSAGAADPNKHRLALVTEFVNKVIGPLEFLDSVENDDPILTARDCFLEYFTGLKTSEYEYFPTRTSHAKQPIKVAASAGCFTNDPSRRVVIDGFEVFMG